MVPLAWFNLGIVYAVCAISRLVVYTNLTFFYRPKLESLVSATSHTPILGLFGALLKDWIPLIDDYYYCEEVDVPQFECR